jgi:hypothetical protein
LTFTSRLKLTSKSIFNSLNVSDTLGQKRGNQFDSTVELPKHVTHRLKFDEHQTFMTVIKPIFATVTSLHVLMELEITVLQLDNKLLYVQLIDLVSNRNRKIRLIIIRFKSVFQIKNNSQIIYNEFFSLSIFKRKKISSHTE